jgi:indoleamine 2,3-dioxygenase
MAGPFNIALEDFDISAHTGFLPEELPLRRLSGPFQPWEEIASNVPTLLRMKTFRAKANGLPIISTSWLSLEKEWRRAYVLLSFLTHSYIWGGSRPVDVSSEHSWLMS